MASSRPGQRLLLLEMPISHEINPLAALDFQLRKGIADAYDLRRPDLQSSIVLISAHFNAICHDVDLPPLGWGIAKLVERGCEDGI
jgi:hypothetical protein